MTPIILTSFMGRIPRVESKLLPDGYAQTATNCDLRQGNLQPVNGLTTIKSVESNCRTLIRLDHDLAVSATLAWLTSPYAGDMVRAQIADSDNRIYATSSDPSVLYPIQINSTMYAAGTGWIRLGMVAPTTALTITMTGEPDYGETDVATFSGATTDGGDGVIDLASAHNTNFEVGDLVEISMLIGGGDPIVYECLLESWGETTLVVNQTLRASPNVNVTVTRQADPQVADTVSYVYTRVVKWDDGSEEESAPSNPTAVTDVYDGQGVELSGFVAGSSNPVTHFRIYRLASGTSGAEFQYLDEIEVSESTYDDDQYDGVDVTTHSLQDVQDDILETEDWVPPPDDLLGLTQYANGILAGFDGNKLYFSEPYVGYAWPVDYALTFDYDIVALAVFNESLIVLTEAFPYIVTGLDPESMSQMILPYEQGCVSKTGVVVSNIGVIYPTPDGLFLLNGTSGKLLTKNMYTKEQWAALTPSDLIAFYYDDCYLGFFRGTGTGIMFNFKENPYVVDISISGVSFNGGFLDPEDDTLYLVDNTSNVLGSWNTGSALEFTWKSKKYRPGDAVNPACAAVVADGEVTFKLYAEETLKHTETISDDEMFRLPGGYRSREWEVELSGSNTVDSLALATNPGDLF